MPIIKIVPGPAVNPPEGESVSQVLPLQLCSATWAFTAMAVAAETVRYCAGGAGPSAVALKVNEDAVSVRLDVIPAVTLSVTLTDCVPEEVVNETVPLQAVPAAIPD